MDTVAISIVVFSTLFMVLLFRGLWKMITFTPEPGEDTAKRILKFFAPAIILGILLVLFFVLVVPNFH